MEKIMSIILSLTIVLGLVTPVHATEIEQSIKLEDIINTENIQLEDSDKLSDVKNDEQISDIIEEEIIESSNDIDIPTNDVENNKQESSDEDDEVIDIPSYIIDAEMEKYLEEYLNSSNKENLDSEMEKYSEEDLNSLNTDDKLDEVEEDLEDGMYTADFTAYKTGTENASSMEKYIDKEKSRIKIKDGKITVQLVINDSTMVLSASVAVNEKTVNVKRTDIDNSSYMVSFGLNSIEDKINVTVECNYSAIMPGMGIRTHDFDLVLSNITYLEELPVEEDLEDGMYTVDLSAYKTGTENASSMEKYIDKEKSRIKIKDGKITVQLVINDSTMVLSASASVNGQAVNTKRTDIDDSSYMVEFGINSTKDKINVTVECNYSAIMPGMGIRTHDFDLVLSNITYLEELPAEEDLEDGMYTVDFSTYKTGTENASSMEKYIDKEKSRIKIKDGKITVQLVINDSTMVLSASASVNGQSVNTKRTDVDDSSYMVEFGIDSTRDKINITVECNYSAIMPGMGIRTHDFDFVINDIQYLGEVEDDNELNPDDDLDDETPEEENKTLSDGTYSIESAFLKANSTDVSVAGEYLNSKSTLTVKDGKYKLTVNVKQYVDAFSNLSATIDGVTTKDVEFVKNSDGTGTISFNINSLSSSISIGCTLTISQINYVNTTEFTVKLDVSTLKNENGESVEVPEGDILPIKKDAMYTINNNVLPGKDGTIPQSARYLDTSSNIEVKHEKIFVTLVFNMLGFMDGRSITLNDNISATSASIKSKDNKTYVSFIISSLSDEIHISSKATRSADDGFTIVLDSKTLVEDTSTESGTTNGSSTSTDSDDDDDDDDLDDGTYTIKNKVLKEDSDDESHARDYVDKESVVTVKKDKMYLTLKFVKASLIKNVSIKVDGKKVSHTVEKKTSDKLYIKFKIGSLSDEILVTTDLDLSNLGITNHDGLAFRVLLRSSTLEEDDDADNYDDDDDDELVKDEKNEVEFNKEEDNTVSGGVVNNTSQNNNNNITNGHKKITYKVNNEIVTESSFGYQAARGAVNKVSYYEIIDDKKYITLGFSQTDIMNNIRLSVNGKKINYDIISQDKSKNTMEIRFEIPSLSTQVSVTTNVTAMGRDISFGLEFLESTLELISTEEAESLSELMGTSSESSSNSSSESLFSKVSNVFSSNNSISGGVVVDEEAEEDLASLAKEYFKKYTISNEVVSDSSIGRSMARKYLNETSIIEDIDGQLYATITFSSASSMGDFRIEVNGETVSHTVPVKDMNNNLISLRFPINSVNDDIKAYIYINPMRMNISFGIKFLEESMVLIEEGEVNSEGDSIESTSLAETLSEVNQSDNTKVGVSPVKLAVSTSALTIVLNQLVSLISAAIKRRSKKSLINSIVEK